MARAFRHRGLSVYIGAEKGERHHAAHAHVQRGKEICWSIWLPSLEPMHGEGPLPKWLVEKLTEELDSMMTMWEELNDDRA